MAAPVPRKTLLRTFLRTATGWATGWVASESWPVNEAFAITLPVADSPYPSDVWVLTHVFSGLALASAADGERLAWIGEDMVARYPDVWARQEPWESPDFHSAGCYLRENGLGLVGTNTAVIGEQWGGG